MIDFQHWGWAPVAFELLYFVAHAVPMWGLQLDSVPWLLRLYIQQWQQLRRADSPQLSVEMLLEEMLFVSVEFCASFLADETFDGRQSEPSTPRQSLRVAGSGTSAAPTSGAGGTTLACYHGEGDCAPTVPRTCGDTNADGTPDDFSCPAGNLGLASPAERVSCATNPCTAEECCVMCADDSTWRFFDRGVHLDCAGFVAAAAL